MSFLQKYPHLFLAESPERDSAFIWCILPALRGVPEAGDSAWKRKMQNEQQLRISAITIPQAKIERTHLIEVTEPQKTKREKIVGGVQSAIAFLINIFAKL